MMLGKNLGRAILIAIMELNVETSRSNVLAANNFSHESSQHSTQCSHTSKRKIEHEFRILEKPTNVNRATGNNESSSV